MVGIWPDGQEMGRADGNVIIVRTGLAYVENVRKSRIYSAY